ncbi:MAG: hypothetical protein IJG40_04310 [Oscillospiraceae bacterium]|nr:hypothetical protein [Oscillospiraceae bacterium]
MNTEENTNEINELLEDSFLKDVIIEESAPDSLFDKFKNSEVGKVVLGEDGKFDMEDIERLAESAKSAIKDAANKLKDLTLQVCTDVQEVKQAADDTLEMHNMEKEIRQSRLQAEAEHQDAVRQMKIDVEAEAKELKELMEGK